MDVIVGRALDTRTPVFAEEIREVMFRPYWNVPSSILRHEILPKLERDPDYLRREDMEIVRGTGDSAPRVEVTADALAGLRQGVLRVRQRPGPKNALGLIKFVFPNEEDVYMHGTPAQALFARSRRDFSHGCVRVADPVALAEWVLHDRPDWTRDRILTATMNPQTTSREAAAPDSGHPVLHDGSRDAGGWDDAIRGGHLRARCQARARTHDAADTVNCRGVERVTTFAHVRCRRGRNRMQDSSRRRRAARPGRPLAIWKARRRPA